MITIPTFNQLYVAIKSDLETQYGVTISPIGKSFLRAFASVQAAKLKLYYLVIGRLQKNIFVDTADPESLGGTLERFGRVKLGRNPFPAVSGQYTLSVTGTAGAKIKAATTFKSDDNALNPAMLFVLDNEYTLTGSGDTILVRALTTGTASKLNVLDTLTSTSPIALVNSAAYVTVETVAPLDAEDIEAYRQAVINSYRLSPQGGSAVDYRLWAQDAQGVAAVYPYAKSGVQNEIDLFVESVIADSTDGKGTPDQSMLDNVESVVDFNPDLTLPLLERGRRPLGVFKVNYLPVVPVTVDIVITGYLGLTVDIQTLLLNALTSEINKIRPFVAAADILVNKNDIIDTNKIIGIIISQKPGAIFTSITININSVPLQTYTFVQGFIPYLNSVTYN